jgi:hypothetical protein
MGKDKEPTIDSIFKQTSHRAEKNQESERISNQIFKSIGQLFTKDCDGVDRNCDRPKLKVIGSFPYLDEDSLDNQLYSVEFLPIFHEDEGSYSFLIKVKNEEQRGLVPLLTVSRNRLEDNFGRVISDVNDLKRCSVVIEKMLGYGRRHLPKAPVNPGP